MNFIVLKEKSFPSFIRMLKQIINELRSVAKGRNIDGYKNMSKNKLDDLFFKPQRSKIPKVADLNDLNLYSTKTKKHIPLPRTEKPILSLRIENNIIEDNTIKVLRNLFSLNKQKKAIKDNLFKSK